MTSGIVSDIQENSNHFKLSKIQILIGTEVLDTYFYGKSFSINTKENEDLEMEIADKLNTEFNKEHPKMCKEFVSKIFDK